MKHFFLRSPQSLISSIALWTSFLHFLSSDFCYTQSGDNALVGASEISLGNQDEPKYTINFNHVPVTEVIRFVSKTTHTNFVFEEEDLQFNVTIISEEPISVKNILSALIQILRIHDLRVLEQEGNLMITKSPGVNQISTLVSQELPGSMNTEAPIVTRVFRIKNANPSSVAAIIKPMTSTSSLIEVSAETRQLIVTDIVTNIDKISSLLMSLDTPNTRLEIESYVVRNIPPSDIITLTQQILSAFAEGNPLILVPQQETNTVFIVSTPYLIEKALTVMEDLDVPAKNTVIGDKGASQDLHIYKIIHKNPQELLGNLKNIYSQVEGNSSGMSSALLQALKTVKYVPDTDSLIFVTDGSTWVKIQEILTGIDTIPLLSEKSSFWIYKIQNTYFSQLEKGLHQMAENVQNKELSKVIDQMKWIKENNSLVFNGPEPILTQLKEIVPSLDVSSQKGQQYFIYRVSYASEKSIKSSLAKFAETLQDPNLSEIIQKMQWIEESRSLVFNGPTEPVEQLKTVLPMLDIPPTGDGQSYVYQIQHGSEGQILTALKEMASGLKDSDLVTSIENAKWIKENNSLLFNGNPETLAKLQGLVPTLDLSTSTLKNNFIIYNPVHQKGSVLFADIKKLADDLKQSGLENSGFLSTLDSVKWTSSINSLLFTGDADSLARIQKILENLDIETSSITEIFLYAPQYVSPDELKEALKSLGRNLNSTDISNQSLILAINDMQWIPENQSFLFKVDPSTQERLKQVLSTLDNANTGAGSNRHSFYMYKLQQARGNIVIQNLKDLTENISASEPRNAELIKSVKNLKWVKENNAILITGSPQSIELVKSLIEGFDVPASESGIAAKTEFFVYKPVSQTSEYIQKALDEFATDLEYSNLADVNFIHTLKSARFVPASKSILFTGTPDSLAKLKTLLATVDISTGPTPIQTIGTSTFLIYKIQNMPATELMNSLQTFSKQLAKSNAPDKHLASSLDSVKWIKETNSLLFTGTEATLQKVETVIAKFDVTTLQTSTRSSAAAFFVYNPKYQTGSELIHILNEFKQNLVHSAVVDTSLFDAIDHLKFIEKTNSLIISGSDTSIEKIKTLLDKFDVPAQGSVDTEISSINNTNFLIYKLQYHKGLEIQNALKKVAVSLSKTEKATSKTLVECIDSLQWIEVTNSLLGTGEADTLEKVKGLIHNLDVPLKQVFIEVLVIQTTIQNSQNFGLQWGSQLQYMNKTIGAMGNFPDAATGANILQNPLALTTAGNPPVQGVPSSNSVPFTNGFDLGVIGDIIFHKGKSFISLGSLLTAIQTDSDTTVVMNPKIMAQDGHTSNIFVGQNLPFIGSFVSNQSNNTTETSNVEYRDVGFNLVVTPTLGTNDVITLDINQVISSQAQTPITFSGGTVTGITTNNTTMTTRVHVPDRHFLVLSGMLNDSKQHTKQGIPCLGGLPMIGALFSQNLISDNKINVMIFMKPYILHSMNDFDHLTDQEETLFKNDAVLHEVKEQIDTGFEMIKNIE